MRTASELCSAILLEQACKREVGDDLWSDLHKAVSVFRDVEDCLPIFHTSMDLGWPVEIILAAARRAEQQGHGLEVCRRLGPAGVGMLRLDRSPQFPLERPVPDFGVAPDAIALFEATVDELETYDALALSRHAHRIRLAQDHWLIDVLRARRLPEHYMPSTLAMLGGAEHDYGHQTFARRAFASIVLCVARAPGVDTRIGALVDATLVEPHLLPAVPGFLSAMLGGLHGLDFAFGVLGLLVSLLALDPRDPRIDPIAEWLLGHLDESLPTARQTCGPVGEGPPALLQCQSDHAHGWAWSLLVRGLVPQLRRPLGDILLWRLVYDRPWRRPGEEPLPQVRPTRARGRSTPKC